MGAQTKIFHESWYQVANQRIYLRSSVRIRRQLFRGMVWFVVYDPFTNQFFRVRPEGYHFVARLSPNKTVEEVWKELQENSPDSAPGQGEIIDLLAQLYHANLLHYDLAPDSAKLFDRYKKRRQKLIKANVLNVMFARIPLIDPYRFLRMLTPIIRVVISPVGLGVWLLVIALGIKTAIDNFGALQVQSEGILAPSNLFLLYASLALIKVFHELGHAFGVHRYGGEVHTMGIMLMVLTPLPYTDATASWAFRRKGQRLIVSSAGMIFEFFIAAIAVMVWANTGEGVLHSLAYNMVFTASVSTLLFNVNPLLRYDGYYILSDILEIPNLQQQSVQQLTFLLERYAFGKKDAESPAGTAKEAWLFSVYAVLSFTYRIFVFTGIMLFIADKIFLLAAIMTLSFAVSWSIVPVVKLVRYLSTSPSLTRVRGRAVQVSIAAVFCVFALLYYLPFPYNFKSPGVLKAVEYSEVVNGTAGRMIQATRPSGSVVKKGDTLAILADTILVNEKKETEASLREARIGYKNALVHSSADLEPMRKRIEAHSKRLHHLEERLRRLTVQAPIDGIWVAPDADDYVGRILPRGTGLGEIINPEQFHFASVISQREISELFTSKTPPAQIRLAGQADKNIPVRKLTLIPIAQTQLPSSALGYYGGGDIEVAPGDTSGRMAAEPFYELRAVAGFSPDVLLLHGRSGKIRFKLGKKSILWQGWRKLRQLVQKHYRV